MLPAALFCLLLRKEHINFGALRVNLPDRLKGGDMKTQIFAATALITVGVLGAANAADLPMPAPAYSAPPAPVYNWTGCYVGGGGGYAFWQQDSFVVSPGGAPLTASQSNGGKGWFGQGQVGCDYQFTAPYFGVQTVIGAFSDIEGGSINGSSSFPQGSLEASANRRPGRLVGAPAYWSRRAFLPTSTAASPKPVSTV